jgi:hypothetical protein
MVKTGISGSQTEDKISKIALGVDGLKFCSDIVFDQTNLGV